MTPEDIFDVCMMSTASPPWSASLPWWWGFAQMTQKIPKIWR